MRGDEQGDRPARLGAEPSERRELSDPLTHGPHDPPATRHRAEGDGGVRAENDPERDDVGGREVEAADREVDERRLRREQDRKSTRLNSSHSQISYAVFCLKKKKTTSSTEECTAK